MKRLLQLLFAIGFLALVLIAVAWLAEIQDRNLSARLENATSLLDSYAKNVQLFYSASNAFPVSRSDFEEYVTGNIEKSDSVAFAVVDAASRAFLLRKDVDGLRIVEARYYLGETGVVRTGFAVVAKNVH